MTPAIEHVIRNPSLYIVNLVAILSAFAIYCAPSIGASDPIKPPPELLVNSIEFYGSLDSFQCQGVITSIQSGFSSGGSEEPSLNPDRVRKVEFYFEYSRDREIRLKIYPFEKSQRHPDHEIRTNENGQFESYSKGKYEFTLDSIEEMAIQTMDQNRELLSLFLDLLQPKRHFKFTSEEPRNLGKSKIGNSLHYGIQLKSSARKTIWINPMTNTIGQVRNLRNNVARRKEISVLNQRLAKLIDHQVAAGNEIAQQIDALSNVSKKSVLYYYDFTSQSFQ